MSYKLFLDDVRNPTDVTWVDIPKGHWFVARNYTDFRRIVENRGIPGYVSFDHDLANEHYNDQSGTNFAEKTGLDCARWLCDHCSTFGLSLPECFVHSMNPVGNKRIKDFLENFKQSHIK